MADRNCIARLSQAAGRELTDEEVRGIFERVHDAARDLKAGRLSPDDVKLGKGRETQRLRADLEATNSLGVADNLIQEAAALAEARLLHEAALSVQRARLQMVRLSGLTNAWETMTAAGVKPLEAVRLLIRRDFKGRVNVESAEQRAAGVRSELMRKLGPAWDALGDDWLGFFQSREKLVTLMKELRGEDTGDAIAKRGAKAFLETAEEARRQFNAAGGDIGRLDDWAHPQHHSQYKVASAGRDAWVNDILQRLDRSRYADDAGVLWGDAQMKTFLENAWSSIATDGHANRAPGKFAGVGSRAKRHAEHRQIHYKDADAVIGYWEKFGERTVAEILFGHVETMARDIALVEKFGPNPDTTYRTLRDQALQRQIEADAPRTKKFEAEAAKLDLLFDYSSGRVKPTVNRTLAAVADTVAALNTAGKLGGAALASFFGDKPMMEIVSHLNGIPALQRWRTELALLNPANAADRRALQRQGLMLDNVRSGLLRFNEHLGASSFSGKLANAVMRVTGMQAINEIRKGAFGVSLMGAIGHELDRGLDFSGLHASDVRALKHFGITEADWKVWKVATLEDLGGGNKAVLTPEAISRVSDADLQRAGILPTGELDAAQGAKVRRDAIVKLLGAVNTESEFAIVTPGWQERATFYASFQRGTAGGEIMRSVLQFKSFPWAMFQRSLDAVANKEGVMQKAGMTAAVFVSTTLAGAMLMQTREMLAGKDPREMKDWKFWGGALLQGGALSIYGDFLQGTAQTRYGSGPIEVMAGPSIGTILELGLTQPMGAVAKKLEGKETHLAAQTAQDLKGWVPGGNVWYAKAALDHLVFQNIFEQLSPGYLNSMRSRTLKERGQQWWWEPGEVSPKRAPELGAAWK